MARFAIAALIVGLLAVGLVAHEKKAKKVQKPGPLIGHIGRSPRAAGARPAG